jgi:serine/threonine protein kinase
MTTLRESAAAPEAAADDLTGVVLGSSYRVLARIGAGGMGVVYRVWDHALDRYAVAKVPRRSLAADASMLARFEREMEAMRRVRHPAVAPVIDFGQHDGLPYAVMPYLAGGSLARRRPIRRGRPAPARSASLRHWLPAIADALDHVHAAGFVHRDVKPDNILFAGRGNAVLADFGIATFIRHLAERFSIAAAHLDSALRLTTAGLVIGTPHYVAPEIVAGDAPDGQADQYALAAVVYEIIAGRPPIEGSSAAETLAAQIERNAPPLGTLRPELPDSLCQAVGRGLAKRPADRFESCREFADFVLLHVPDEPSAPPRLACPLCDRMMAPPPAWAGRNGRCPGCRAVLSIADDLQSVVAPSERLPGRPDRRGLG